MKKIISAKNIIKDFNSNNIVTHVLRGIDIDIYEGEINTILGASGGGKTTLLNILSALDKPTSGEIFVDNVNISNFNSDKRLEFRRKNVGYVFQTYKLINNLSVRKNVELAAYLSKEHLDIDEVLEELGIKNLQNKYPSELSGGEQQRVAIARAIVKNEKLLFCDEPTGALDEENSKKILNILKNINEKYFVTIIMITHNPSIRYMSHKTFTLNSGKIENVEIRNSKDLVTPNDLNWGL